MEETAFLFYNLKPVSQWHFGWFSVVGPVLGIVGCFAAALPSAHEMPVPSPPAPPNPKWWAQCFQIMPNVGSPGGTRGKEPACQGRRREFDPWVGKIPWRRQWQLTPVFFLPGESHGQRSLVGYSPWGHKEPDMTEHSEMLPNVHWEDILPLGENMELYLINKTTWASLVDQVVKNPPAM